MNMKQKAKSKKQKKCIRGSVLVMTLIVASGIMIVSAEFALFVVSALRQARAIDHSIVASYAAESGLESGLFQIRREKRTTLRKEKSSTDKDTQTLLAEFPAGMKWTLENSLGNPPITRFANSVTELKKSLLQKNETIELGLYEQIPTGLGGVSQLESFKIVSDSYTCPVGGAADQKPWYEISVVLWSGGSIDWNTVAVTKEFLEPSGATNQVILDFDNKGVEGSRKPMLVRIKPLFCDVVGMTITLHKDVAADPAVDPLNIPNYFFLSPEGTYQTISQRPRAIVFPAKESASGIFDYVLFSEQKVIKEN